MGLSRARGLASIAAVAAATVVAALPSAAQALSAGQGAAKTDKSVLRVKGSVSGISASGPRVAIDQRLRTSCDRILLWRPVAKSGARKVKATRLETAFGGTDICEYSGAFVGLGRVVLAGQRIAWTSVGGGNTEEEILYTRTLRKKKAIELAFLTHEPGDIDLGSQVGAIAGRGSASSSAATLVWNEWDACEVPYPGDDSIYLDICEQGAGNGLAPEEVLLQNANLSVYRGAKTEEIRTGADAMTLVALGGGRIALMAAPGNVLGVLGKPLQAGTLTLVDLQGTEVRSFPLPAGTFRGAALDAGSFYTIRDQMLEVYELETGAMTATYPAKAPADEKARFELTSVSRGIVTYARGNSLHVVRISDGARFKIVKLKDQGPVDAELTSKGLYYSFNTADRFDVKNKGKRLGRVVFLPMAAVQRRLG